MKPTKSALKERTKLRKSARQHKIAEMFMGVVTLPILFRWLKGV